MRDEEAWGSALGFPLIIYSLAALRGLGKLCHQASLQLQQAEAALHAESISWRRPLSWSTGSRRVSFSRCDGAGRSNFVAQSFKSCSAAWDLPRSGDEALSLRWQVDPAGPPGTPLENTLLWGSSVSSPHLHLPSLPLSCFLQSHVPGSPQHFLSLSVREMHVFQTSLQPDWTNRLKLWTMGHAAPCTLCLGQHSRSYSPLNFMTLRFPRLFLCTMSHVRILGLHEERSLVCMFIAALLVGLYLYV